MLELNACSYQSTLRNELWKLFGKKRTYIGFGAFLLAQNAMLLTFRFTHWQAQMERMLAGNGYLAQEYVSALTVAVIMLIPQILLLMPLYAALVGGDLVAKEVEDGTLRMILSRPISRFRLLLVKWVAGVIFSAALVLVLGGTALGFARIWFPWKGMFVFVPGQVFNVLSAGEGFKLYLCSHLFMTLNASVVLGIAFMFSCFNMKPAAATILALSLAVREPGDGRHPVLRAVPRILADLPFPLLAQRLCPADPLGADGAIAVRSGGL